MSRFHLRRLGRSDGFTLIEIIVATAIIGIAFVATLTLFTTVFGEQGKALRRDQALALLAEQMGEARRMPLSDVALRTATVPGPSSAGYEAWITRANLSATGGASPTVFNLPTGRIDAIQSRGDFTLYSYVYCVDSTRAEDCLDPITGEQLPRSLRIVAEWRNPERERRNGIAQLTSTFTADGAATFDPAVITTPTLTTVCTPEGSPLSCTITASGSTSSSGRGEITYAWTISGTEQRWGTGAEITITTIGQSTVKVVASDGRGNDSPVATQTVLVTGAE